MARASAERPDRFHSPHGCSRGRGSSYGYGTHHTARQYAHSQVFTQSYKKCLGRSRIAARSRNFHRCERAVSLARSRSTPRFSASFSRPHFSSASTRDYPPSPSPSPALTLPFLYAPSFSPAVSTKLIHICHFSAVREMARRLTSSSSPIRRFSMRGLTPSAARSSGPSPGSSST